MKFILIIFKKFNPVYPKYYHFNMLSVTENYEGDVSRSFPHTKPGSSRVCFGLQRSSVQTATCHVCLRAAVLGSAVCMV